MSKRPGDILSRFMPRMSTIEMSVNVSEGLPLRPHKLRLYRLFAQK